MSPQHGPSPFNLSRLVKFFRLHRRRRSDLRDREYSDQRNAEDHAGPAGTWRGVSLKSPRIVVRSTRVLYFKKDRPSLRFRIFDNWSIPPENRALDSFFVSLYFCVYVENFVHRIIYFFLSLYFCVYVENFVYRIYIFFVSLYFCVYVEYIYIYIFYFAWGDTSIYATSVDLIESKLNWSREGCVSYLVVKSRRRLFENRFIIQTFWSLVSVLFRGDV